MNRAFLEYFRPPAEYFEFDDGSPFRTATESAAQLERHPGNRRSPASSPKELQGLVASVLTNRWAGDCPARLCSDPAVAVDALRQEEYVQPSGSGVPKRLVRRAYYGIRPFLPVSVRKHLQRIALRDWQNISFPRWPVDTTVDVIMDRLMRLAVKARANEPVPFIWFWPEGRRAACMLTHDVETTKGRDFCSKLMDVTGSEGFRSSFQVVPEKRYEVPESYRREILERGFELNIHGLNHDGSLFREWSEFLVRAGRMHDYAEQWGARGFRSPVLYRNAAWMRHLPFEYDMSFPNVAHLDPQRGGCCTVMPYFLHHLVELPLTTTQDYTLFHILEKHSIDLWMHQIEIVTSHHGLISFNIHPDYLIERRALTVYRQLLERLRETAQWESIWCARPGEIASWWRERSQMRLERNSAGNWRVTGPGASRACVAYARLEREHLTIAVEPAEVLVPVTA